ncbi:HNH endonuclease [Herbaspirillum sp. DW155]|uniref:HNH endonuclease n=1 Tax=Herbaspirillum sp. DW155 TaxID=3095609 RepID=UPI0030CF801A
MVQVHLSPPDTRRCMCNHAYAAPSEKPASSKEGRVFCFVLAADFLNFSSYLQQDFSPLKTQNSNILEKKGEEMGKELKFFWVNIGKSHTEAIEGQFLWAPLHSEKLTAKGVVRTKRFSHWDSVATVNAGDVIFCNVDRKIAYIAVAKQDAYEAAQPSTGTFTEWDAKGRQVDVEFFKLEPPISIEGDILESFKERYNERCKPRVVTKTGSIFQGYMASLPLDAGIDLLRLAGDQEEAICTTSLHLSSPPSQQRRASSQTTKQALREARIGQGRFRKDLLNLWRNCPITDIQNSDLLIASHIKPWAVSSDEEKLDPYNGFLFAVHIDRLFDKGLISFDTTGKILISPHLSEQDARALNIHREIVLPLRAENQKYLAVHRQIFGLEE